MPVRTKQLAGGQVSSTANAVTTIYTCSPDETTIIKSVVFRCRVAGPASFSVRINNGDPVGDLNIYRRVGLVLDDSVLWEPWIVLQPGDEVKVSSTVASAFVYLFSGTELEGVAD